MRPKTHHLPRDGGFLDASPLDPQLCNQGSPRPQDRQVHHRQHPRRLYLHLLALKSFSSAWQWLTEDFRSHSTLLPLCSDSIIVVFDTETNPQTNSPCQLQHQCQSEPSPQF
ncbi:hypothetical protein M407DRAFT_103964 [Tulasnella calospora MUT 4182]|uniref:Uncharacterized protein n=1 Tax=Tulasnella calospora MUT 4182 TaxID=1051891 RepID=A0A0C3KRI4_9AGAM|nr:hypothetical protein M407DRAFT_103964 [Tulasnella calospora MUT 4182]